MTVADAIVGGRIATLAGGDGFGWVEALAIADGRVAVAGSRADVEQLAGPRTRRISLGPDEVVLPGLTDAHVHLAEAALGADRIDLGRSTSLADALAVVAAAAARRSDPEAWLEGGGWDPNRWVRWPTAEDLEASAPGRRVALWAHDHHALLVSRRVLAEAGIDATTPDPPGGAIRRAGADRWPSGVLHEHASRLVTARIPPPDAGDLDAAIERWSRELLSLGIVAVHDMGALAPDPALGGAFAAAGRLDAAGRLAVRVHAGIREESLAAAIERGHRTGDPIETGQGRARVGWWKRFADGSLGSRTAYLREPYEDADPEAAERRGVALVDPVPLAAEIRRAADAGIATAVHAIGDAAVDLAIASFEVAGTVTLPGRPLQSRIEHAQLVADDQLSRLRASGIALSMQPIHARTDGPSLGPAWGARARALGYRWRSIVDAGVRLAFGSDAPVEAVDPWPGLAAAFDRTAATLGTSADWLDPAEALTLPSALRGVCVAPALVAGEPDRGRLVAGQRADLGVVALPPGASLADPAVVAALRPRLVLVDGAVAWEA
ncbi:MAG TPA: amidohydrolase [Candidatus Limnocylindrales bacterium]|nr:amidohydrolase [Candidatus Limnocylindrales bacterium]